LLEYAAKRDHTRTPEPAAQSTKEGARKGVHRFVIQKHAEDHPLEYESFEGTIPPGNYGAGTVMVWDRGEYEDLTGNPAAAFHAGKMHIIMRGTKLKGEWILVKDRREEDSNKWLLIKAGEEMPPI